MKSYSKKLLYKKIGYSRQHLENVEKKLRCKKLKKLYEHFNLYNSLVSFSKYKIPLLSKVLKFVPARNGIDKAKLKIELETFGRMLRLKWYLQNDGKHLLIIDLGQNQIPVL